MLEPTRSFTYGRAYEGAIRGFRGLGPIVGLAAQAQGGLGLRLQEFTVLDLRGQGTWFEGLG